VTSRDHESGNGERGARRRCSSRARETGNSRESGRRVVVTGVGIVSAVGIGGEGMMEVFAAGNAGTIRLSHLDNPYGHCRWGCKVMDLHAEEFADRKLLRYSDQVSAYALAASVLAMRDAGEPQKSWDPERAGVCIGTMAGAIALGESELTKIARGMNIRRLHPLMAIRFFPGNVIGLISIAIGLHGKGMVYSNLEVSATDAIAAGFRFIRSGESDIMVVGGSEAPLTPFMLFLLERAGRLTARKNEMPDVPCPFDASRDGVVLGDGAAVLILEERELAIARGARIYAEICGYGYSHGPNGRGGSAMFQALADADICPGDVDFVSATGASTIEDDIAESEAIASVLGERAPNVPVSSVASMVGHTLGASGAFQAASCVLSIWGDTVFPIANLEKPDERCMLSFVSRGARRMEVSVALQNTRATTGDCSSIVFRKESGSKC
jgi:3-oxoacyl-[acyl-carrier-protein] synthase II